MNKKRIIGFIVILLAMITIFIVRQNSSNDNNIANSRVKITVEVYDKDNSNILSKSIDTDKEYLIDALSDISELKLITEESEYGAYITSVMGIAQDNEHYWSYYIDDNYATVGVSSCKIEQEKTYSLKLEKIEY